MGKHGTIHQVEQGVLPYHEIVEEVGGVAVAAYLQFLLYGSFAAFMENTFQSSVSVTGNTHLVLLNSEKNRDFFHYS